MPGGKISTSVFVPGRAARIAARAVDYTDADRVLELASAQGFNERSRDLAARCLDRWAGVAFLNHDHLRYRAYSAAARTLVPCSQGDRP